MYIYFIADDAKRFVAQTAKDGTRYFMRLSSTQADSFHSVKSALLAWYSPFKTNVDTTTAKYPGMGDFGTSPMFIYEYRISDGVLRKALLPLIKHRFIHTIENNFDTSVLENDEYVFVLKRFAIYGDIYNYRNNILVTAFIDDFLKWV